MALVSTIYGANAYNPKAVKRSKKKLRIKQQRERANGFRQELMKRATPAEVAFKHILVDLRVEYEFQKVMSSKKGNFRIVDFWLPQLKVAIEIDGEYHANPVQQWKDACRTLTLITKHRSQIKNVIRFTNNEVLNHPDIVKEKLLSG